MLLIEKRVHDSDSQTETSDRGKAGFCVKTMLMATKIGI
jgi:hypothetical protein